MTLTRLMDKTGSPVVYLYEGIESYYCTEGVIPESYAVDMTGGGTIYCNRIVGNNLYL